jgi:hypothetical protein
VEVDDSPWSQYQRLQRQQSRPPNDEPLSIVVVDNDLSMGSSDKMDSDRQEMESTSHVLHRAAGSQSTSGATPGQSSVSEGTRYGNQPSTAGKVKLFWTSRIWPALCHFNNQKFPEPSKESLFQKEAWYSAKRSALYASLFFLITWIAFCSFLGGHTLLYWVGWSMWDELLISGIPRHLRPLHCASADHRRLGSATQMRVGVPAYSSRISVDLASELNQPLAR